MQAFTAKKAKKSKFWTTRNVTGGTKADELVARILKKPVAERFKLLRETDHIRKHNSYIHFPRRIPLHRRSFRKHC